MRKKIIIALVVIVVIALAVVFYFYRQPISNAPTNPSIVSGIDDLKNSLMSQKELKKFASVEELKDFFKNRPAVSVNNYIGGQAFGLREDMVAKVAAPEATGLGSGSGSNFSTTNIQVAGVDEADIIKTDGDYIYSVNNNIVSIIKAQPALESALISSIKLEGQGQSLYLKDDKLVVFGFDQSATVDTKMMFRPNSYLFLNFYDISDRTNPRLLKNFKFEGSYNASRLIDQRLYLITTNYNFYPAGDFILPKVFADGQLISSESNSANYNYPDVYYVDTASAYNVSTIISLSLDDLTEPLISQVYMMPAGENVYVSAGNLYLTYTKYLSDYQLRMSVARELMFDKLSASDQKKINMISEIDSTILSDDEKAGKINQIIDNHFARLSETDREPLLKQLDEAFQERYQAIYKELEKTVIHKIGLDNGALTYKGSAEVSGRVLNQFSMDENKGYFRVATTRSQSWIMPLAASFRVVTSQENQGQESYNNVYALDDQLSLVGVLENLAPGERIYSVRFMGDRAYVVTFKQTDPLFVIDLKDPSQLNVAGQLKIPGFSSYLHPYKENMLIGVGKEVIDNGSQGIDIKGLKLSLFDVTSPAEPKEIANLAIGGRGSDTPVLFDHKAFLLIPDKDLLAIPMSLTKADSVDYSLEFQGLGIFKIEPDKFSELGRVYHPAKVESGAINYSEAISRSLYIGDYLYSLSSAMIGINQLSDLKNFQSINLPSAGAPIQESPAPIIYEKTR